MNACHFIFKILHEKWQLVCCQMDSGLVDVKTDSWITKNIFQTYRNPLGTDKSLPKETFILAENRRCYVNLLLNLPTTCRIPPTSPAEKCDLSPFAADVNSV